MKVTAKMIAKEAGVSEATVSLILNGKNGRISEKTREKVLEIAEKYDFTCNRIAVSLATNKTKTLGIILPNLTNPLFPRLVAGVEKLAQENDYALFVCNCEESADLFINYFQGMKLRCIDGLIVLLPSEIDEKQELYYEKVFKLIQKSSIPIVLIEREMPNLPRDYVCLNNKLGGYMATEYLIQNGYQKIGHITGTPYFKDRTDGYKEALKEYRLSSDEEYIIEGDFTVKSGYDAAIQLLKRGVDAIFAGNDLMALGASRAIAEQGMEIAKDVGIIGFDDDPIAEVMPIPLTTIRQAGESMGRKACELILQQLQDSEENHHIHARYEIDPILIKRASAKKN